MSEVTRIFWFSIGIGIGWYIAQHLQPEPPRRKAKETPLHVVKENRESDVGRKKA